MDHAPPGPVEKEGKERGPEGPEVLDDHVLFRLPDPQRDLAGAVLHQELVRPRAGPPLVFDENEGGWTLRFDRGAVDRMEYKFELIDRDGTRALVCDPANPLTAAGPFGDRSVVEFPGYEPPPWIEENEQGTTIELSVRSRVLGARVPVELWSPSGARPDDRLPLLVAHDGPEYRRFSRLIVFLAANVVAGRLPPLRAALVGPVRRDDIYSASAAYARSFVHEVLPTVLELAPAPHGRTARIGMGASLGALAMLHVHRRTPAAFGALFLQSGSFFRQRFDKQEIGFPRFRRISRFVGEVLSAEGWAHPIPVAMTCGSAEENLFNNRATGDALQAQGYEVGFAEVRDAHNWTAWRDALDPHLTDLIARMWG